MSVTVPGLARYLHARVRDLARYPWAGDLLADLTRLNDRMARLIDTPPARIYVGTCQGTGRLAADGTPDDATSIDDGYVDPCGADMYIRDDDHQAGTVRCRVCGSTYSLATRAAWVRLQYVGRLVTVAEAATLLGIPRATIDTWVHRRRVLRRPNEARNVYLFDELIDLARATRPDAA